jgi:capsular polysaccharide biosynthesis protein
MIQILKRNWQLILIVILVFCLVKSCNKQPTVQSKSYKKEKDSLQKSNEFLEFQINGLAQENSQIIDSLKKFVKQSKITENKLYQLQKKTASLC